MGVSLPHVAKSMPLVSRQHGRKRARASNDVVVDQDSLHDTTSSSPSTVSPNSAEFTFQAQPVQRMVVGAVVQMLKGCARQGDVYTATTQVDNAHDPVLNPASAPLVSLSWYLRRILHYLERWHSHAARSLPLSQRLTNQQRGGEFATSCYIPGSNVLLTALVYINRVGNSGRLVLTSRNVHRVLLVAMMLAHRYLEDSPADCQWFAQVGGVSKSELKRLETLFISAIEWRMFVSTEQASAVRANIAVQVSAVAAACAQRSAIAIVADSGVKCDLLPRTQCVICPSQTQIDQIGCDGARKRTRVCV
jgi:hypothetical protein